MSDPGENGGNRDREGEAEKWKCEQRAGEKNAKYFFLIQSEKLEKLPKIDKKEI